jgi:hypothetical protein
MTESIPENQSPINQACKHKLLQAKESPSPDKLYLLQLAMWGLDNVDLSSHPNLRYRLEQKLGDLQQNSPEEILSEWYPEQEQQDHRSQDLAKMSPEEAAFDVIEDLVMEANLA